MDWDFQTLWTFSFEFTTLTAFVTSISGSATHFWSSYHKKHLAFLAEPTCSVYVHTLFWETSDPIKLSDHNPPHALLPFHKPGLQIALLNYGTNHQIFFHPWIFSSPDFLVINDIKTATRRKWRLYINHLQNHNPPQIFRYKHNKVSLFTLCTFLDIIVMMHHFLIDL